MAEVIAVVVLLAVLFQVTAPQAETDQRRPDRTSALTTKVPRVRGEAALDTCTKRYGIPQSLCSRLSPEKDGTISIPLE